MIHVKTMLGLGDAFAARPTIAALLRKDALAIETPWPEVFEDLIRNRYCGPSESVFLKPKNLNIRCAKRNSEESKLYADENSDMVRDCVGGLRRIQLSYSLHKGCASIPEQIAQVADDVQWDDFFMPNAHGGEMNCDTGHRHSVSPLGVFRAPTVRTEYRNRARNCNMDYIYAAVDEIGGDWLHLNGVGRDVEAFDNAPLDMKLGESSMNSVSAIYSELSLPSMLDLVSRARVVVSPVSWLIWAALAYQVPHLFIWGGYTGPETILGPLAKDANIVAPEKVCACFRPDHQCNKNIDADRIRAAALTLREK